MGAFAQTLGILYAVRGKVPGVQANQDGIAHGRRRLALMEAAVVAFDGAFAGSHCPGRNNEIRDCDVTRPFAGQFRR